MTIPFRADHVGSLLRPARLADERARWRRGEIDAATLREAEDRAIREAVQRQEAIGLQLADRRNRAVELHRRLIEKLTPLLDDATMFLVTGYRALEDVTPVAEGQRLSQDALLDYAAIAQLGIEGNLIGGLLAEAANTPDVNLISPLRERFEQNITAFMDLVEAAKHYPCVKKAWFEFLGEQPTTAEVARVE